MKKLFLPEGTGFSAMAFLGSPWGLLAAWLAVMNLLAFLVFGIDKWKAKRKKTNERVRRVPEKTLFALAALGGSAGALLGMRVWHHKTLHKAFRFGIPAILIFQMIIFLGLYLYWKVIR